MANTSEIKALPLGETDAKLTWEEFKTITAAAMDLYPIVFDEAEEEVFHTPLPEAFHQAGMLRCYYEYLGENASTWGDRELDPGLINACFSNGLIGADVQTIHSVIPAIGDCAGADSPVLIRGETGTGKDIVAKCIHDRGSRTGEFVAVNCAGLPDTLLESLLFGHVKGSFTGALRSSAGHFREADEGTIFLDEIGDMSSDMQAKILRTLNNGEVIPLGGRAAKKVDVRVIAATNVDIEEAIRTRKFRSDLLHRINTMEINIWPLFLRPGDLPILVYYFIREWNNKSKGPEILAVTNRLLQQLILYRWPGNVRELKSLVERACIVAQNQPKNSTVLAALDVAAIPLGLSHDFLLMDKRWLNRLDEQVKLPKLRTLDIRSHMQQLDKLLPKVVRFQWHMVHKVKILTAERQSSSEPAGAAQQDPRKEEAVKADPLNGIENYTWDKLQEEYARRILKVEDGVVKHAAERSGMSAYKPKKCKDKIESSKS